MLIWLNSTFNQIPTSVSIVLLMMDRDGQLRSWRAVFRTSNRSGPPG